MAERLNVSFHSASRLHLDWLRAALQRVVLIDGAILTRVRDRPNAMYELRLGKHASLVLLRRMYAVPHRRDWTASGVSGGRTSQGRA